MPRQRVFSGGPWEESVGYCRATRVDNFVFVSGSTAMKDGELVGVDDPAAQTRQTMETVGKALHECGATFDDIVRYRVYVTNIADWQAIATELVKVFGNVLPCNTLVEVSALIDPRMLVEIEVDAIIDSATPVE